MKVRRKIGCVLLLFLVGCNNTPKVSPVIEDAYTQLTQCRRAGLMHESVSGSESQYYELYQELVQKGTLNDFRIMAGSEKVETHLMGLLVWLNVFQSRPLPC